MSIGNIIIDNEFSKTITYENVNVTNEFIETNMPTLVVGWERTKQLFPNISILNKKIKDNLYWTFSPREKRGIYEEDVKSFITKINDDLLNEIEFINVDPILYNVNSTKQLISRLEKFSNSVTYLYGDKIYFYHDHKIYHIDVNLLEFIGIDTKVVIDFFNDNFKMVDDYNMENIDVKYIPYLYYRDEEKDNTISDVY